MRSFAQFHQNLRGSAPSPAKAFEQPPVVVLDPRVDGLQTQVVEVVTTQGEVTDGIVARVDDLQAKVENVTPRVDALETKVDEVIEAVTPVTPVSPVPPPPPDPVDPAPTEAPSVFEMIRGIFK